MGVLGSQQPISGGDGITDGTIVNADISASAAIASSKISGLIGLGLEYIPASSLQPRTSNGCAPLASFETTTNKVVSEYLAFDKDSDEFAFVELRVPSGSDGTFTVTPIWTTNSTDTGGVTWSFQAVSLADDDTFDTAFGTAVTVDDAGLGTAKDVHVGSASGTITPSGSPAVGDYVQLQVFRDVSDANDTHTADAWLVGLLITWTAS
jgi:hypothetical protein